MQIGGTATICLDNFGKISLGMSVVRSAENILPYYIWPKSHLNVHT